MTEADIGAPQDRFTVHANASEHFAWLRTRLAVENTLMAWLRTAISLIGFGFAIVQFFNRLRGASEARPALLPDAPLYLGLALITCGILALVVSLWQYWSVVRYLRREMFAPVAGVANVNKPLAAVGTAVLLILIGLFALFAVLFQFA